MPKIASVGTFTPPFSLAQENIEQLTKELFEQNMPKLERLLKVFGNGDIDRRYFCVPADWYRRDHTFEERNQLYTQLAIDYSVAVITRCLTNPSFLDQPIETEAIDALFFISSTGIATPSIDARVMNVLPFSNRLVRVPIWGLGCGGGAAGISRAFDYCRAHPKAKVLVVCVELCSLAFQKNDYTKSNIVGTSIFADGAACVLICGDEVQLKQDKSVPHIIATRSRWLPKSESVMGWQVKNTGFHVVFSKSIPVIIEKWLGPFIQEFLADYDRQPAQIVNFVAHPGGKKVLQAYEEALQLSPEQITVARDVLRQRGNMSSPTVFYVLEQFMEQQHPVGTGGLLVALGPGFSGEAVLLEWGE